MGTLKNSQRNYGIDLLRMFAMFLIAILHVLGQGGILINTESSPLKYNIAWFLEICAFCCVNCYAIISGYVGLNSKFKCSSIIMLWFNVLFYTILITLFFGIFFPNLLIPSITQNKQALILDYISCALLPVSRKQYWYFSSYVLCYLFTPILNKAVQTLDKNTLKKSIIAILLLLGVPTICTGLDAFSVFNGYCGLWLMAMYLVGAYIKKYDLLNSLSKIQAFSGYIASVTITWLTKFVLDSYIPSFQRPDLLINYTSPTIIASAVFLFILFKNINPSKIACKVIGFLSPLAFSVYLIHVHPLVWIHFITGRFSEVGKFSAPLMTISIIGLALGIYIVCSAIDIVRFYFFKLIKLQKLVVFIENKILNKFGKKDDTDNLFIEYNYDFDYPGKYDAEAEIQKETINI